MPGDRIIDADLLRVGPHGLRKSAQHVLVALEQPAAEVAHGAVEPGQMPEALCGAARILRAEALADHLRPPQRGIRRGRPGRRRVHQQGEAVHMAADMPPAQAAAQQVDVHGIRHGDLHDHLDAGLMQRAHHGPELPDRIRSRAVGSLRGEPAGAGAAVAPVVDPLRRPGIPGGGGGRHLMLRGGAKAHHGRPQDLVELIGRHQDHLVDAEIAQVPGLFLQAEEGPAVAHAAPLRHGKAAHMQMVGNNILKGNRKRGPVLPPVKVCFCKPAAQILRRRGLSEVFSAEHRFRGGIESGHAVDLDQVAAVFHRQPAHQGAAQRPVPGALFEADPLRRFIRMLRIVKQHARLGAHRDIHAEHRILPDAVRPRNHGLGFRGKGDAAIQILCQSCLLFYRIAISSSTGQ